MQSHKIRSHAAAGLALGLLLPLAGCGQASNEKPRIADGPTDNLPAALASVFRAVPSSGDSASIPELRKTAKPGEPVLLEAKVMGVKEPFVEHRAVFIVGDESILTSCDVKPEEGCATAWDNCCDAPETVRAGTATIQVVDDSGAVIRHGIRTVGGLKELSRVRIAGAVAPQSTEAAFVINATAIEVL
jgi:hypothetical protein